jgi:hypothetical protein
MDLDEIDLEFMEQEAEERLTPREALLLGLPSDLPLFLSLDQGKDHDHRH